jgi:DNA anti-recombination protein RmuC
MQIEETAKDIIKRVDELGKHLKVYEDYHGKLGNSLSTTINHFNASNKELRKLIRMSCESQEKVLVLIRY